MSNENLKKKISSLQLLEIFLCAKVGDWILITFAEALIIGEVVVIAEAPINYGGHKLRILNIFLIDQVFIFTLRPENAILTVEFR